MGSYDLFLADDRILPLLPRLLGKKFFESKKFPISVKIKESGDLAELIDNIRNETHFTFKAGSNFTVRVGKVDQEVKEITANVLAVAKALVPKAVDDANLIQSLHLKSSSSVALPIYLSNPIPLLSQVENDNDGNNDEINENKNNDEDEDDNAEEDESE